MVCGCSHRANMCSLDNSSKFPLECSSISQLPRKCNVCDESSIKLKLCGRCKLISYCSKACQLHDWKLSHKRLCPFVPLCPPKWSPSPHQVQILQIQIMTSRRLVTQAENYSSWLQWLQKHVLSVKDELYFKNVGLEQSGRSVGCIFTEWRPPKLPRCRVVTKKLKS